MTVHLRVRQVILYELEVNEGGAMVERRAQLVGLRGREIALRLQHEEILDVRPASSCF